MQIVTKYPDGVFCWVDLTTPDVEGAKAFYSGLFGWETDNHSDSGYYVFRLHGYTVAGVGPMSAEAQAGGAPPVWISYVKHDDIDSVAGRVANAGGTIFVPPMDVAAGDGGTEGRFALLMDPTGATFGVWQPDRHTGAQLVNAPNALVWNELQTRDTAAAEAFYRDVFGWTTAEMSPGYSVCQVDGRGQAGMIAIQASWGDVPPNWSVYFQVDDVPAAAARAEALGGGVAVPPSDPGQSWQFAVLRDPQGAHFTVAHWNNPSDPPPGETKEV